MSAWLIGVNTALYLGVMWVEWRAGNHPVALIFAGYSFANVGFIWGVWR